MVTEPLVSEKVVFDHGRTGDGSVSDIPFQVFYA